MPAPIALFTYNRLRHIMATINALKKNELADQSDLYIFSDGAAHGSAIESVQAVRKFLVAVTGFRAVEIIEREKNLGLGNNIIDGVNWVLQKHGRIIVLEDDLISSPWFLRYMNDALEMYEREQQVISIHAYCYPVKKQLPETFFLKGADCLGWATWRRGWEHFEESGQLLLEKLEQAELTGAFDFDHAYPYTQMLRDQVLGKNSSWAVRWYASAFLKNMFTLYPGRSLIFHAGGDGSGTNTGFDQQLNVDLAKEPVFLKKQQVAQNLQAYQAFAEILKKISRPTLMYRIKRKLRRILYNVKQ